MSETDGLLEFRTQVSERYFEVLLADGWIAPVDRTAGWLEAVDFEMGVASADRTCREPAFRLVMSMLADPLEEFARSRADDLAKAAKDFDALVAQAEREWQAFEAAGRALVVAPRP